MSYYGLEDSSGHLILEDGSGDGYLLESATTLTVTDTLTLVYDITGQVTDTLTLQYDILADVLQTITLYYDINGDASTNLVRQNLAPTLKALNLETTLIEKTDGPFHYSAWIHMTNLASGDTIILRVYKWEPNNSVYELYEEKQVTYNDLKTFENNQTAIFLPFIPAQKYKVTIEQTAGTLRAFPWELYKTG